MARSPYEWIQTGMKTNIGEAFSGGISATVLAGFSGVIAYILSLVGFFTIPIDATAEGVGGIIGSMLGGAQEIIWQGAQSTIVALAPGSTWAIGPLAFTISILAVGGGAFALSRLLAIPFTSDFALFSNTDFLGIGSDENNAEDD